MNDDAQLLRQFAENHDQACFGQLVQRHIGFVYAVCLRRVRDPHTAQDATQAVFVALARKAAAVAVEPSVIGWLHRSACYETRNLMRAHAHRAAREAEAHRLGMLESVGGSSESVQPVLDEVLRELSGADREAILARYFAGRSYAQIGERLALSENAARMRVDRALAKLRDRLARRGITSTAVALATALPAWASTAVPGGFVASVTVAAVSGSAAAGAGGLLAFMSTGKIIVASVAAVAVAGFVYQRHANAELESDLAAMRSERAIVDRRMGALQQEMGNLKRQVAEQQRAVVAMSSAAAVPSAKAADPAPAPGVTVGAPKGWHKNGSNEDAYDVGTDQNETWGGMPSAYVSSAREAKTDGFGGMMQTVSAEAYRNKRVRLTGWIKTQDANNGGGHLWFRVDGSSVGHTVAFDNMAGRAPSGTTDWQQYSLVLDVPAGATTLNYGMFIQGRGKMWVNGVTIDPVGPEVATTDLMSRSELTPKAPQNLGFAPAK